jgi:hypothetical protein
MIPLNHLSKAACTSKTARKISYRSRVLLLERFSSKEAENAENIQQSKVYITFEMIIYLGRKIKFSCSRCHQTTRWHCFAHNKHSLESIQHYLPAAGDELLLNIPPWAEVSVFCEMCSSVWEQYQTALSTIARVSKKNLELSIVPRSSRRARVSALAKHLQNLTPAQLHRLEAEEISLKELNWALYNFPDTLFSPLRVSELLLFLPLHLCLSISFT